MAGEAKLQKKIIDYLEDRGCYVLKVMRSNKSGHPDLEVFTPVGKIWLFEVKDKGKKAEPLQEHRHEELRSRNFKVLVVDDYDKFKELWIAIGK